MEPRIQYARTSDGVNIAFWSIGEGLPVISMPPVPWSHVQREWDDPGYRHWYERLAQGMRLIRYDTRGSGLSDRDIADLSQDELLLDIDAVAGRLGLDRFVLVAPSGASAAAVKYAARSPERVTHLILWCPWAREKDIRFPEAGAMMGLKGTNWELFIQTVAHAFVAGWDAGHDALRFADIMRASVDPGSPAAAFLSFNFDVTEELPRVQCPTLVLHRRDSQYPSSEAAKFVAAQIPNAHLVSLEGGALLPHVGDMEAAVRAVSAFLGTPADGPPRPAAATAPAPPVAGLQTILFTDVEGSTALTQRLGDAAARELLREHERITREALSAHGGSEVKTMGDGFMASFSSATRALECAVAIQRAFSEHGPGHGIRVRIGLNAGEPIAEEDDLHGTAVITAARIAALAAGGEILVSNVVRELVAGKGFLFSDRGETVLRGFEDPVRVHELRWQDA